MCSLCSQVTFCVTFAGYLCWGRIVSDWPPVEGIKGILPQNFFLKLRSSILWIVQVVDVLLKLLYTLLYLLMAAQNNFCMQVIYCWCLVHNLFLGAQAFIWVGGCWKSQKERNGAPLIHCFNISFCFVLCYGEEVPFIKMEDTEADGTVNSVHKLKVIYYFWLWHIMNFLVMYLQLQWFCKYISF